MCKATASKNPPLCPNCGAVIPPDITKCLICHYPQQVQQSTPDEAVEVMCPVSPNAVAKQKSSPTLLLLVLAIGLLVVGLSSSMFEILTFQGTKALYNTKQAVVYQQNKRYLKIQLAGLAKPLTIRTNFRTWVHDVSPTDNPITVKDSFDSRYIAYFNNQRSYHGGISGDLYLLDMIQLASPEPTVPEGGIRVSPHGIIDFQFSPKDHLLAYVTEIGDLYICDYSKTTLLLPEQTVSHTKIATNVAGIAGISGDQILFFVGSNELTSNTLRQNRLLIKQASNMDDLLPFDLYTINMVQKTAAPKLIDTEVINIFDTAKDYRRVCYAKQETVLNAPTFEVYLYNDQQLPANTRVAKQVSHVVTANALTGQVVYLKANEDMVRFEHLFIDDMKEIDAELTREDTSNEELLMIPQPMTNNDTEEELTPLTTYEEKLLRDALRNDFRKQIRNYKTAYPLSFGLYDYQNGTAQLISGSLPYWQTMDLLVYHTKDAPYFLFVSANFDEMTPTKLSEYNKTELEAMLAQPFSVPAYLSSHTPEQLTLYDAASQTLLPLYAESGERFLAGYQYNTTTKEVMFILYPSLLTPTGTLYEVSFITGKAGTVSYIDDQVVAALGVFSGGNSGILYQTASRSNPPEYIIYHQRKAGIAEVDIETAPQNLVQMVSPNKLLYFKNYNIQQQIGTFMEYQNESREIARRTLGYIAYNNGDYLILQQQNNNGITMFYVSDGKKIPIDRHIGYYTALNNSFFPPATN